MTTSDSLLYLYCILKSDPTTIEDLQQSAIPGLEPSETVFPVEGAGLLAAVSHVPSDGFLEQPLNDLLLDLPRLTPYVLRHDQTVRAVQELSDAVIPMTFGSIYRSAQGVTSVLEAQAAALHRRLEAIRGRQEWEIKLFRRPEELVAAVSAASDRLRSVAEDAASAAPGKAYLLNRLHERELVNETARAASAAVVELQQCLEATGAEVRVEAVEVNELSPADQQLIYKLAALVPTSRTEVFRSAFVELKSEFQGRGLPLELSGPWAPYSFVTAVDGSN